MTHSGTSAEQDGTGHGGAGTATYTVLLYSNRQVVRDRMRQAIGTRPAAGMLVKFLDAANYDECIKILDQVDVDLVLLDGEAQPTGGIGIARQLHDEIDVAPPICLVVARSADRWLAAYAKVDAILVHPLDPMATGRAVAGLLRGNRS